MGELSCGNTEYTSRPSSTVMRSHGNRYQKSPPTLKEGQSGTATTGNLTDRFLGENKYWADRSQIL